MKLDIHKLVAEVRRLATESPDNRYIKPNHEFNGCYYNDGTCTNGAVGCIFGQAFRNLDFLIAEHGISDGVGITTVLNHWDYKLYEPSLYDWCAHLQMKQDKGLTWSEALKYADELNPSVKPPLVAEMSKAL